MEIIKEEDEELKLKKNEPSSKEILPENIFIKNENESEKEKGKENNKNNIIQILKIKNNFTNGNENEQKQEKNSENDLSNIYLLFF